MYRGSEPEEDGAEERKHRPSDEREDTSPSPPQHGRSHMWEHIPLGRVCVACQTVQAHSEFDDDVQCNGHSP
jgi:hypothetical protein